MNIDPKTNMAPHDCPECGEPAYLGFGVPAKCSNRECRFFDQDLWVDHVMCLPDDEEGIACDIEDEEATDPWLKLPALKGLAGLLPDDDDGGPLTPMQLRFLGRQLSYPDDKGFSILDGKWLVETKQEKLDPDLTDD